MGTGLSVRENRSVEGEAEIVCNVFVAALPRRDSAFARATEEYVVPIRRAQKLRIAQQPYSSANTQHRARNSKKGKYDVNSTATMGTMSANATTSFVVN